MTTKLGTKKFRIERVFLGSKKLTYSTKADIEIGDKGIQIPLPLHMVTGEIFPRKIKPEVQAQIEYF